MFEFRPGGQQLARAVYNSFPQENSFRLWLTTHRRAASHAVRTDGVKAKAEEQTTGDQGGDGAQTRSAAHQRQWIFFSLKITSFEICVIVFLIRKDLIMEFILDLMQV